MKNDPPPNKKKLFWSFFDAHSGWKMTKLHILLVGSFLIKMFSFFTFFLLTARPKWLKLLFLLGHFLIKFHRFLRFYCPQLVKNDQNCFFVGGSFFIKILSVFTFLLLTQRIKNDQNCIFLLGRSKSSKTIFWAGAWFDQNLPWSHDFQADWVSDQIVKNKFSDNFLPKFFKNHFLEVSKKSHPRRKMLQKQPKFLKKSFYSNTEKGL